MDRRQIMGVAGAATLFVGVFLPIVSLPIVGAQNFFQNGRGDGTILLVIAGIALLATLAKRFTWVSIAGIVSLALLGYTFIAFRSRIAEMRGVMERDLADNPFKGIGEAMMQSVQLQWGWAVLVVGALLLCAAGLGKGAPENQFASPAESPMRKCPECAEQILADARKCRYCGSVVEPLGATRASTTDEDWERQRESTQAWLRGEE
jgi:hypothetical protein